jgi:hypothetical protein
LKVGKIKEVVNWHFKEKYSVRFLGAVVSAILNFDATWRRVASFSPRPLPEKEPPLSLEWKTG